MRTKEYEQMLLQKLAKLHEDIIKKAENTEKYNLNMLRGREYILNKVIEEIMGLKFDSIRVGKEVYRWRYFSGDKVRHIRNMFKRR